MALDRLLALERNRRRKIKPSARDIGASAGANLQKASDAYALYVTSSEVDTVPLAIALWRLRLWEDTDWSSQM